MITNPNSINDLNIVKIKGKALADYFMGKFSLFGKDDNYYYFNRTCKFELAVKDLPLFFKILWMLEDEHY